MNFGKGSASALGNSDRPYSKLEDFPNFEIIWTDSVMFALGAIDSCLNNWKHKANFAASYKFLIDSVCGLPSRPQVLVILTVPMITNRGQFLYNLNGASIA